MHPLAAPEETYDLRQSIMQLHFSCHDERYSQKDELTADLRRTNGAGPPETPRMRSLITQAEHRSFADAHLTRPHDRAVEMLEADQYQPSADDVQHGPGSVLLSKPLPAGDAQVLPMYGREEDFQQALMNDGSLLLDRSIDGADDKDNEDSIAYERRAGCSRQIDALLTALMVPSTSRIPRLEAVLDYAPLVRNMVRMDDAEEAAHEARIQAAILEVQAAGSRVDMGDDVQATSAYQRASASLAKLGIRPSRHTTKMLLQRGGNGLLELTRRETDFCRWLLLDVALLDAVRCSRLSFEA